MRGAIPGLALLLACGAGAARAQSYRVRLDARLQAVSFRGLASDSIDATLTVPGENGGPETPDGYAVRCGAGRYCFYYRPGPPLRAVPVTTSGSIALWGLGVPGLSVRATGRLLADIGRDRVWPGTEPSAQLLEGYVEYERRVLRARAGRQLLASRLEPLGFDGAWARLRWDRAALEVTGYGGWGLGRAAAVPITDPALNPLDEWRPRRRQLVAGAEGAWRLRAADLRAEYRREVDPEDDHFVSERAALSGVARLGALRASAGADYDLAQGHVGSADAALTLLRPRFSVSSGVRRYRPYFSLWTLWSAFSPVPYTAVHASGQLRATPWLTLTARGERYRFDDAGVSTALVPELEDRGWRTSAGATAQLGRAWTASATMSYEHGPGASGRYADGAVRWTPTPALGLDLYGGTIARPLELRVVEATSRWIGARADLRLPGEYRLWSDVAAVDDGHDRPDAAGSSLSQLRVRAGVSVAFGTEADRAPLPPARPVRR